MTEDAELFFRCPNLLQVTPTPVNRVAIIGQCLLAGVGGVLSEIAPGAQHDYLLFNKTQDLPEEPPHPAKDYDFQLVSVPLRSVVPEEAYMSLPYNDSEAYTRLFDESVKRMRLFLSMAMKWNRKFGMLTFVLNYLVPQHNPMGKLLPRYDLRNFAFFVERLNEALCHEIATYQNTYLIDLDQIVATIGRRYFQNDSYAQFNHGAGIGNSELETSERLEPMRNITEVYPDQCYLVIKLLWVELLSMYRTIRQHDSVKLVITDLDDTMWRGIAAEQDNPEEDYKAVEGWPFGYIEALGYLKRRGILLAIVSKNEESLVTPIYKRRYGHHLPLENFAIKKINWRPKVENLHDIFKETNILPQNTVFIDDNPVERASICAAFPAIRTLGGDPFVWRRILLWAPETQVATITDESSRRTEMIQAQVERENMRQDMSREQFLASLGVKVTLRRIADVEDSGFARALELTNKSNQFNTTGQRWTLQELRDAMHNGLSLWTFSVEDRFTHYGTVGVLFVSGADILQYVMSCRVVGLEVELAVIARMIDILHAQTGAPTIRARLQETELNALARDLWPRCGFTRVDDRWIRPSVPSLPAPAHIQIT